VTSLGAHLQMARALIAPMVEGATKNRYGFTPDKLRYRIRAMSAATDNVGLFFGEDVFVASGASVRWRAHCRWATRATVLFAAA
jgi:uncharacterized membrane protein